MLFKNGFFWRTFQMFFKYHDLVRSYFRFFLGPVPFRSSCLFGLIHPFSLPFSREWLTNLIPRRWLSYHYFFQLEFNGWRSEFFWETFGTLLIYYAHVLEAQAQRSLRLYLLLTFCSCFINGKKFISSTFRFY